MSQTDELHNYDESLSKKAAVAVGSAAAKKAGQTAGLKLGAPVIVVAGVAVILVTILAAASFLLLASGGEEKRQEAGYWGGGISEIGANEIPAQFIPIYKEAEQKYGVPWNLLAAHHRVETRFSTIQPMVSPVGAEGPLQFMPCTFTGWGHPSCSGLGKGNIPESEKTDPEAIAKYGGYGVDGDGDGKADPFNLKDAIFSAANYLKANGAADGNIRQAVFAYNHADWYVEEVLGFADRYVKGYVAIEPFKGEVKELVETASRWFGNSTYIFGAGRTEQDINDGRFDCSAFIHWVYKENGVSLGPVNQVSTETLKHVGKTIPPDQLKPGDLVFFDTYKKDGHVGIYLGNGKFLGSQTSTGVAIADMSKGYWKEVFNGRVKRL